jgi:hypothetical protein
MQRTLEEQQEKDRAYRRAYHIANRERVNARNAAYYAANREKMDAYRAGWRAKNISRVQKGHRKARHKMLGYPAPTRQVPSVCECCGKPSEKFLDLDHCHISGEFRGWLCNRCNRGLGFFDDSIEGLMNAVRYLERAAEVKT